MRSCGARSVIHLLDVNVLLALGYTAHVHNDRRGNVAQHRGWSDPSRSTDGHCWNSHQAHGARS